MLMLTMILMLEILPVIIGYSIFRMFRSDESEQGEAIRSKVDVGDRIVYRKVKFSPLPGPGAYHITPSDKGENYTYLVDKYWVVTDVLDDGSLVAMTRRGKLNFVRPDDPNLRKAKLIDSLFHRNLFPSMVEAA